MEKKQSLIMTIGAIVMIVVVVLITVVLNIRTDKADSETIQTENSVMDAAQTAAFALYEGGKDELFISEVGVIEESTGPVHYPDVEYDYSFMEQSAEEIYGELFTNTEETTEYVHFYIEDGVLYLDEYAETGEYDEEGLCIYEWNRGQKIAENVIFVDYNWYRMQPNALYITSDHVLHGTGEYEDIYLENIKFARTYADQMIALTMDGNLWCKGWSYSLSDGRELEYQGWELVMQNVVFANLTHYGYLAITEDDSLYMWGDNTYGQLGDGSLLENGASFKSDCYFYPEPVKVADNIKMVWERHPGNPKQTEEFGELRTYFLTNDNTLYVSGEGIGNESRSFTYFGEMGQLEEPFSVKCTSKLHEVVIEE